MFSKKKFSGTKQNKESYNSWSITKIAAFKKEVWKLVLFTLFSIRFIFSLWVYMYKNNHSSQFTTWKNIISSFHLHNYHTSLAFMYNNKHNWVESMQINMQNNMCRVHHLQLHHTSIGSQLINNPHSSQNLSS